MSTVRPRRLVDGPADARWTVVLAHGSSIPMDHPFLTTVAEGLAKRNICVVRFEFPYMRRRFLDGTDSGESTTPNKLPRLQAAFRDAVAAAPVTGRLAVAGKSMGARVAGTVIDDVRADAMVALGYPFHAPGKADEPNLEPLSQPECPSIVIQGTHDTFGTKDEVAGYDLGEHVELHWLEGANHGFEPTKGSETTAEAYLEEAIQAFADFLNKVG